MKAAITPGVFSSNHVPDSCLTVAAIDFPDKLLSCLDFLRGALIVTCRPDHESSHFFLRATNLDPPIRASRCLDVNVCVECRAGFAIGVPWRTCERKDIVDASLIHHSSLSRARFFSALQSVAKICGVLRC